MFAFRHVTLFLFCLCAALVCPSSAASRSLLEFEDEIAHQHRLAIDGNQNRKRHLKRMKKSGITGPSGKGAPSSPGSKKVKAPSAKRVTAPTAPIAPAAVSTKSVKAPGSSKKRALKRQRVAQ